MSLKRIHELSLSSVIEINDHKLLYEDAEVYLSRYEEPECPKQVRQRCIETDTIVVVQSYPRTQIESYIVVHFDLDLALVDMVKILEFDKEAYRT